MSRTKWMRLVVREPADVLRWANDESARQLDAFRYRVIRGREYVSFRMVPRYAIEIGTREIYVVACARGRAPQRLAFAVRSACRRTLDGLVFVRRWLMEPRTPHIAIAPETAELYHLPTLRLGSPSQL